VPPALLLREATRVPPASEEIHTALGAEAAMPGTWEPPHFYICLDVELQDATIDSPPLDKETTFVCLNTALDDSQEVNLAVQCLLKVI
jgi:hypothetical protein